MRSAASIDKAAACCENISGSVPLNRSIWRLGNWPCSLIRSTRSRLDEKNGGENP